MVSDIGALKNITVGKRANLSGATSEVISFVEIMDGILGELGIGRPTITSALRTSDDQARIMLKNFNKMRDDNDSSEIASKYINDLYSKFPNIEAIAKIFKDLERTDTQKKDQAKAIISDSWPKVGHLGGSSIDIAGISKSNLDVLLGKMGDYASFRRLWEPKPGAHYHITVDSITSFPGQIS